MSKYIPAEKLIAEIERLDDKYRTIRVNGTTQQAKEADLVVHVLHELSNFIGRIQQEQPAVDLDREIIKYKVPFTDESEYLNETTLDAIAHHFYELGLNARKEE